VNRQMRIGIVAWSIASVMGLTSCATEKMTLTNDQGQTVTCEDNGLESFQSCVDRAKARGFKETQSDKPVPSIPY
jgi:hypothetical protein